MGPIVGVLRTFAHDAAGLDALVASLAGQTRPLDRLIIIENNERSLIDPAIVAARLLFTKVEHRCLGENRGPAGAAEVAVVALESEPNDDAWVVILDDDIPLVSADYLETMSRLARGLLEGDPLLGGLGRIGHRFDWERGRIVRPRPEEIRGLIPVDYLPTGYAPMFRLSAIVKSGGFRGELFVGLTEVELGLRLRRHGFNLYAVGSFWRPSDAQPNVFGVHFPVERSQWRRYYSVRNLIAILREGGRDDVALRATVRSVAGAAYRCARQPAKAREELEMTARGVVDGWAGRLGARVRPGHR